MDGLAAPLSAIGPFGFLGLLVFASVAGMALGYRSAREGVRVRRGAYFAGLMFVAAAGTVLKTVSSLLLLPLPSLASLAIGNLVVLAVSFLSSVYLMQLTAARAVDIWGSRRRALLICVPFAVLLFLLRPSRRDPVEGGEEILAPYAGARGVGIGLAALVGVSLAQGAIASAVPQPGLEDRLQLAAVMARQPAELLLGLDVVALEARGAELTMTVRADPESGGPIPADVREGATAEICAMDGLKALVAEGATFRLVFTAPSGEVIDELEASPRTCGPSGAIG